MLCQTAFKVYSTVQGEFSISGSLTKACGTAIPYMWEHLLTRISGVGFRDFTQKRAVEYGLKGWVKNTTCGRVEGEAQGDEETLKKFLKDLDKGPRHAHVVKLEKRDITVEEGEDHFTVKRTSESLFESTN
ncbi:acylphosphatase [Aspergillus clavatus NRRL 1]|uniref:acylphosphatase n=1 Tax=Aspergillus clavatus (strain ATCC 1007 / CBS 513.65 / DSM 816 / NCTC 3887 / NRRL 1 / QM 1276 / 107) TaxID=344612 RepID=A1CEG9_ASPCL|nr:uncharacterized protein ACLA_089600 [Aspergillus clavatus NRRL 1]EAW11268.1 predicted protein [Aspergillus clavatus NRRL 1]